VLEHLLCAAFDAEVAVHQLSLCITQLDKLGVTDLMLASKLRACDDSLGLKTVASLTTFSPTTFKWGAAMHQPIASLDEALEAVLQAQVGAAAGIAHCGVGAPARYHRRLHGRTSPLAATWMYSRSR
jgi:hypothetical protein